MPGRPGEPVSPLGNKARSVISVARLQCRSSLAAGHQGSSGAAPPSRDWLLPSRRRSRSGFEQRRNRLCLLEEIRPYLRLLTRRLVEEADPRGRKPGVLERGGYTLDAHPSEKISMRADIRARIWRVRPRQWPAKIRICSIHRRLCPI